MCCLFDQVVLRLNHSWWLMYAHDKKQDCTDGNNCFGRERWVLFVCTVTKTHLLVFPWKHCCHVLYCMTIYGQSHHSITAITHLHYMVHSSFLVTSMIYRRCCSIGGEESSTVYQIYFREALQTSVEGQIIYCLGKDPNTWINSEFRNISLCFWWIIAFAGGTYWKRYFSSPAAMKQACGCYGFMPRYKPNNNACCISTYCMAQMFTQ